MTLYVLVVLLCLLVVYGASCPVLVFFSVSFLPLHPLLLSLFLLLFYNCYIILLLLLILSLLLLSIIISIIIMIIIISTELLAQFSRQVLGHGLGVVGGAHGCRVGVLFT